MTGPTRDPECGEARPLVRGPTRPRRAKTPRATRQPIAALRAKAHKAPIGVLVCRPLLTSPPDPAPICPGGCRFLSTGGADRGAPPETMGGNGFACSREPVAYRSFRPGPF